MSKKWIVEGYIGHQDKTLQRIALLRFPALVGRDADLTVSIAQSEVSRHHAEFIEDGADLYLRDLKSTNGTFVNREKLTGIKKLVHGDILHFASYEVRIIEQHRQQLEQDSCNMTIMNTSPLSHKIPMGLRQLQDILDAKSIQAQFQAIVDVQGNLHGYEVLGRGSHHGLTVSPMTLFRVAESLHGKDAELSLMMRDCGVHQAALQSQAHRLFVNTHPAELTDMKKLMASLTGLREQFPELPLVLEIHEDAVTDVLQLKAFAKQLSQLNIDLAYDDFGAGQARLLELIEVPVKYVKFDIALIRGLPTATEAKRKMVAALAAMIKAMGIKALAEGVETQEELALCKDMGFDLIQGYYFSRPSSLLDYKNST